MANKKKYTSSYLSLGGVNNPINTETKTNYRYSSTQGRAMNNIDKSYIQVIKQVNWNFSDASVAPVPSSDFLKTEKQIQFTTKPRIPNNLPQEKL